MKGARQGVPLTLAQIFLAIIFLGGLVGCAGADPSPADNPSPVTRPPAATNPPLPTLYPTSTGIVPQQPELAPALETRPPAAPTGTPVDLTRPVFSARLTIPALAYDRSLAGTLAGALVVEDFTTGERRVSSGRGRTLAEIAAALENVPLEPLPDGCERCTALTYELAAEGVLSSGWLRDGILLASLEFFFSRELGPHFPPETVIGLHRMASGYTIGQTTAVLANGTLWQWLAPDDLVPPSTAAPPALLEGINRQPLRFWEAAYAADCPFYPDETLLLVASGERKLVALKCPELAVPTTLAPFYAAVSLLTEPLLADERNVPFPDSVLPLDALIFYSRADGAALTVFADGRLLARGPAGESYSASRTPDEVRRWAEGLATSGIMPRGVQVFVQQAAAEYEEILLVRDRLGVYELPWSDRVGQALLPEIVQLETVLFEMAGELRAVPTPLTTIDAATNLMGTVTISPQGTISATISPTKNP